MHILQDKGQGIGFGAKKNAGNSLSTNRQVHREEVLGITNEKNTDVQMHTGIQTTATTA